jgi:mono/diheme cytochrome c family protein
MTGALVLALSVWFAAMTSRETEPVTSHDVAVDASPETARDTAASRAAESQPSDARVPAPGSTVAEPPSKAAPGAESAAYRDRRAEAAESAGDAALLARGRAVYDAARCSLCHSIAGVGSRKHPLDGVGERLSPDDIRTWIVAPKQKNPQVRKPAYTLSAEELDAIVSYLAAGPPPSR